MGALSQGVLGSDPDPFEWHIKPIPSQLRRGFGWVSLRAQTNLSGWGPQVIEFPVVTPAVTTFMTSALTPLVTPLVLTFVAPFVSTFVTP